VKKPIIALLTDFGLTDHYAASLKAVILSINPNANIVDISHSVRPQNINEGAFLLREVYPHFPKGTIFVGVVDPGVGSLRRALCIRTSRGYLIGPDNGILSRAVENETKYEIRKIENDRYFRKPVSHTFHGRDIFAPVAAHLSLKDIFSMLGPLIYEIKMLTQAAPQLSKKSILGEIMYMDRFGNAISNISKNLILARQRKLRVKLKSITLNKICDYFSQGKKNELMAVWNSSDWLEFAIPNGSAQAKCKLNVGDKVQVTFK